MKRAIAVMTLILIGAACSSRGPSRAAESQPANGPVVAEVAIGETHFQLHDEVDGCVSVEIFHRGLQQTVQTACLGGQQVLSITDSCGWLEDSGGELTGVCDVQLPAVLFGQVIEPAIGHVCIGTIRNVVGASGVTGARFVNVDASDFILEPAIEGEGPYPHLFTVDGLRYGDPPLDAPSAPIYELCEEQAPWLQSGLEYSVDVMISLADELRTDEVTIHFQAGLGEIGVSGAVFENHSPVPLVLRVPASSNELQISVRTGDEVVVEVEFPWPNDLLSLHESDEPCASLGVVAVQIGTGVLSGEETALQSSMKPASCAS